VGGLTVAKKKQLTYVCLGFKVNGVVSSLDDLPVAISKRAAAAVIHVLSKPKNLTTKSKRSGN
jgi:hypothetical protein